MIIFDLDGTLADCEHRRHYVDGSRTCYTARYLLLNPQTKWKPDWNAFYQACDKDTPIWPVVNVLRDFSGDVQIWSGRCESVRDKTLDWLANEAGLKGTNYLWDLKYEPNILKMRPVGDNTPDDELKERWLDETLSAGQTIDGVFDDRPKVVRMWRRRGIFVFDCNQNGKEF